MMHAWLFDVIKASGRVKTFTFQQYMWIYDVYIKCSPLAAMEVARIRPLNIQQYYNTLYEQGASRNTIKFINLRLHMFFKYALNNGVTITNPLDNGKAANRNKGQPF